LTQKESQNSAISQKAAEAAVKSLASAMTNLSLYGEKHPLSAQSLESMISVISKDIPKNTSLTVYIRDGALHCDEKMLADNSAVKRLVSRMTGCKMSSFSLVSGLEPAEAAHFVSMLADNQKYPTAESMQATIDSKGMRRIKLNTVRYQKVTEGQVVVDSAIGKIAMAIAPAGDAETGREMLKRIASTATESADMMSESISGRIARMRGMIDGRISGAPASTEEVVAALSAINSEILRTLKTERASGSIMKADETAIGEAEALTFETITRIVKEEYSSGAITPAALARLIRRLIPGVADLKRLLPALKKSLAESGLSERDYLALMQEMAGELENEGITDILRQTGEAAGLSVDEIIKDIKKNPETAVNMILLSGEIQQMTGLDGNRLQALMGEYLERLTNELLLSNDPGGRARDFAAMGLAMEQVREAVTSIAVSRGLDAGAVAQLGAKIASFIEEGKTDGSRQPLQPEISKNTGNTQQTGASSETGTNVQNAKKPAELPPDVLGLKGISIFLDREIKRHRRYGSPLSCLCVSTLVKSQNGTLIKPPEAWLGVILRRICEILTATLRDLDLIGSLGSLEENFLLIILSMTDSKGAMVVKQRLEDKFNNLVVAANNRHATPAVISTILEYDSKKSDGLSAYTKLMSGIHRQNINSAITGSAIKN
jgi:hypothetical protein